MDIESPRATYRVKNGSTGWPLCRFQHQPARREDARDRLAGLVVRAARPRGEPDAPRSLRGQPVRLRLLDVLYAGDSEMHGARVRIDAARVLDVIRRHALGAERSERDGVARVEAADHDHRIERLLEQREHGILPLLRRAADGVERAEVSSGGDTSRTRDRCANGFRNSQGFARQHRRLIRNADALEMDVRVEARRDGVGEVPEKRLARAAPFDVLADDTRFLHMTYDDVLATIEPQHLLSGRAGFFVMVLPVNERREAVAAIRLDALPDVEHRPTGGVYQNAADVPERLEGCDRHAESGQDHDVFSANSTEVEFSCLRPLADLHAHPAH